MKYKSTTKLLKGINEIFDKIKYPLETRFSRNSKIKIREIINGKDELKSKKENKAKRNLWEEKIGKSSKKEWE